MRILFCHDFFSPGLTWEALADVLPGHEMVICSRGTVAEHLRGVDIIVPFSAPIPRSIIEQGTFGAIHEFATGLDNIDIEAATDAGVWVAHLPGAITRSAESVAELALMHMLMLARRWNETRLSFAERKTRGPAGTTLWGKTACVVGTGDIGTAVAQRLLALGMRVTGVRKHPEQGAPADLPFQKLVGPDGLDEVLPEADYVVLCLPANCETFHIFDTPTFAMMKRGSFLVNVGRGQLVDVDALHAALRSRHLAGAGLDVFWQEPVDPQHPLFQENVVVTPHVGGITDTSFWLRVQAFAANIERYAQGQPLLYTVNQPAHSRVLMAPARRA